MQQKNVYGNDICNLELTILDSKYLRFHPRKIHRIDHSQTFLVLQYPTNYWLQGIDLFNTHTIKHANQNVTISCKISGQGNSAK